MAYFRVTPVIKPGRRKKATINVYYLNVLQVKQFIIPRNNEDVGGYRSEFHPFFPAQLLRGIS